MVSGLSCRRHATLNRVRQVVNGIDNLSLTTWKMSDEGEGAIHKRPTQRGGNGTMRASACVYQKMSHSIELQCIKVEFHDCTH